MVTFVQVIDFHKESGASFFSNQTRALKWRRSGALTQGLPTTLSTTSVDILARGAHARLADWRGPRIHRP
jgi:hypothetical protein